MADIDVDVDYGGTLIGDVEIHGLDNIHSDNKTTLVVETPEPVASDSRVRTDSQIRTELAVTQPIVTDATTSMALDVKPLVSDTCVRLELGKVPPTRVCQPYRSHWGFTLFGIEIVGFDASGESRVVVEDLPRRPEIEWGGLGSGPSAHSGHAGRHEAPPRPRRLPPAAGRGLVVRLGDTGKH